MLSGTEMPSEWDKMVAGALDPKFTGIAREMAAAIGPNARVALVPGAGHAAHLERPAETAALVEAFLVRRT